MSPKWRTISNSSPACNFITSTQRFEFLAVDRTSNLYVIRWTMQSTQTCKSFEFAKTCLPDSLVSTVHIANCTTKFQLISMPCCRWLRSLMANEVPHQWRYLIFGCLRGTIAPNVTPGERRRDTEIMPLAEIGTLWIGKELSWLEQLCLA